jgi:hypothetical protein
LFLNGHVKNMPTANTPNGELKHGKPEDQRKQPNAFIAPEFVELRAGNESTDGMGRGVQDQNESDRPFNLNLKALTFSRRLHYHQQGAFNDKAGDA